jgi:non-ribosomal peptide synthase protein (TIGR01720 family)
LDVSAVGGWDPGKALRQTKDQLRRVPVRGFGYGILRYVSPNEPIRDTLNKLPQAELAFNYLGQFDQLLEASSLFKPAVENVGPMIAEDNHRRYVIEVNAMVVQGRLQASWNYSNRLHCEDTIQRIATRFVSCLRQLIDHCLATDPGQKSSSDFPLANLTEKELARIASATNS